MINTFQRVQRHRRRGGDQGGFTLLEVLIVIVVLGILAAVVIFALGGITGESAVAACQGDGATLLTAIATFNNQNPSLTVTQGLLLSGTAASNNTPYVQSWPSVGPHFAFAIPTVSGTPSGATLVGHLYVSVTPAGAVDGTGSYNAYTVPASCNGAS